MTNEQLIVLLDQILENLNRIYDEIAGKIHKNFKCAGSTEERGDQCILNMLCTLKRYINSLTVDKQRLSGTLHD